MDISIFNEVFASTNHWSAIWPELLMAGLALLVLCLDLFLPSTRQRVIPLLAIFGSLAIGFMVLAVLDNCECMNRGEGVVLFSGMISYSPLGQLMRVFFPICAGLVSYLGMVYLSKQQLPKMEFFHIVLVSTAAMMLLSQASNFVMLFVALETVTIAFYVLVSYCRTSPFSLESGLKYLILGGASSSILLMGIVLLYGASGNPELVGTTVNGMDFGALSEFIKENNHNRFVQVGAVLVLCGIFFKIGAVPFQIWIPDVYQGAPTPVTAFLAVASKSVGFVMLIHLVKGPFQHLSYLTEPILTTVAALTILFGNMTAITQHNVKRMMGLSGVAHAGYLLVGIVALVNGVELAESAILFYLFTYLLGSFAVFGVMAHVAGANDESQELSDYQDFSRSQPFMAGILAIGLGSLAGIPPLAGFIGKMLLFVAAFKAQAYGLLGVSILGVVISIYYYFGWIREVFFKAWRLPDEGVSVSPAREFNLPIDHKMALGALAILTVFFGIYQGGFSGILF